MFSKNRNINSDSPIEKKLSKMLKANSLITHNQNSNFVLRNHLAIFDENQLPRQT